MRQRLLAVFMISALLGSMLTFCGVPAAVATTGLVQKAARGLLRPTFIQAGSVRRRLPMLSLGVQAAADDAERNLAADAGPSVDSAPLTTTNGTIGCSNRTSGGDIRVNQDCTYRRQAEEIIKVNPTNQRNIIAGQNDSRIGYNHCGFDYTFDGGRHWGDGIPPFWQHTNNPTAPHTIVGGPGTAHTYDFASDPAETFDSQGNAYFSCIVLDINDNAAGVLVTRSPAGAGGSFYNNVPDNSSHYVVVEDNDPRITHDKEFIVADSYPSSPFRDNVYVTWTVFQSNTTCGAPPVPTQYQQCASPIYFAKSTDHGLTWSAPVEISGTSSTLCFFGNFFDPSRNPHACDFDQGSDPIVLPNGNIVVVFNNGNTPPGIPNGQQLAVISTDGGNTWSAPVKVGDDIVQNQPTCDFGRGPEECIPGSFVRSDDYPRIAVDTSNGTLYTVWHDFRNGEFDVNLTRSTDGGATWSPTVQVTGGAGTDFDEPAVAVNSSLHQVAISYYRTPQVPNEAARALSGTPFDPSQPGVQAESSDYALAGGFGFGPFAAMAVSPPFPPPDGVQAGFWGDYSSLATVGVVAYPVWSDTRNAFTTDTGATQHDEDVFTAPRIIPFGRR